MKISSRFSPIMFRASATLAWLILILAFPLSTAQVAEAQQCKVEMISPKAGDKVKGDGLVKGTASIPANAFLWVLAHREGLQGWWPQGGGPARVINGEWKVLVVYGKSGELGTFEVAVVVVDARTNEDLKKWVHEAPHTGYSPTEFPNTIEGCPIRLVVVEK